jgi:hypothetical protein
LATLSDTLNDLIDEAGVWYNYEIEIEHSTIDTSILVYRFQFSVTINYILLGLLPRRMYAVSKNKGESRFDQRIENDA